MRIFIYVLVALFVSFNLNAQSQISYRLYNACLEKQAEEFDVVIKFSDRLDYSQIKSEFKQQQIPSRDRVAPVVEMANALIDHNVEKLSALLSLNQSQTENIRKLWVANAVCMTLSVEEIDLVTNADFISLVDLNLTSVLFINKPIKGNSSPKQPGGREPGHDIINAPAMWALGYTGAGTTLLTYDTGFWPGHPAISSRYLGNYLPQDQCWYPYDLPNPGDKENSHGTHVTGTVLGLDPAAADTIGVAPGAYFISTDPIVTDLDDVRTFEELAMAYEWALNPDGDLSTTSDIPDVINNSWGRPVSADVEPCNQIMIDVFALVEAAGIANVFSAGNSGPDPMTISAPHNINEGLVNSFTVGALNMNTNLTIASFSSRGPSFCAASGSLLIKPEVSAPGVNVRSAVGQYEYDNYNGTSMAAPHVSGAVLLLKEAFPALSGEEILLALYYSAVDLGDIGEDNVYGNGVIDVFAAYEYLIDEGNIPEPPHTQSPYDLAISELLSPVNEVSCSPFWMPLVVLQNEGDSVINDVSIEYENLNTGLITTENFTDLNIQPGSNFNAQLSPLLSNFEGGNYEMQFRASILDAGATETDSLNNYRMFRGNIRPEGDVPFYEDFEDGISSIDWYTYNDDLLTTWDTVSAEGLQWSEVSAYMNFYDYNPRNNQKDELHSRTFDVDVLEDELFLSFDYAYQRRGNASVLKDTLRIFAREDCTSDWDLIWEAHSDSLSTMPENSSQSFFPDSVQHWKSRIFDLSNYIGSTEFQFKFHSSNRNGNNFFLDNVRLYFGSDPIGLNEIDNIDIQVLNNPSDALFMVNSNIPLDVENINVYDLMGKRIDCNIYISDPLNFQIDLSGRSTGIYLLSLNNNAKVIRLLKTN